jgi:hypothetical protein
MRGFLKYIPERERSCQHSKMMDGCADTSVHRPLPAIPASVDRFEYSGHLLLCNHDPTTSGEIPRCVCNRSQVAPHHATPQGDIKLATADATLEIHVDG